MNKSKETLKAYEVRDDHEGYCAIVFSTNGAAGRREGASELDIEWESVESCCRKPEFDCYAPGPVPPMVLIEHGWWFECGHCGKRVSEYGDDDDIDPEEFDPRPDGKHGLFCSAGCECQDHLAKRDAEEAADALREVFDAKFPGAEVRNLHVYRGPKLLPPEGNSGKYVVTFAFPGGQQSATWHFGDDHCFVIPADVGAFEAWRKGGAA